MVQKLSPRLLGNHVHVQIFTATDFDTTFANNGELIFSEGEWDYLFQALRYCESVIIQPHGDSLSLRKGFRLVPDIEEGLTEIKI